MGRQWFLAAGAALSVALVEALAQAPAQPIAAPDLKNPVMQAQAKQPALPQVPDLPPVTGTNDLPQVTPAPTNVVAPASLKLEGTPSSPGAQPPSSPGVADATAAGNPSTAVSGGATGAALNAPDASDLLTKSLASTGVEIQRRNPIIADPRIRGLRSTQYNAFADGAWFIPSRLDLDSVVSRFDPGSIRDILVVKGPYASTYGPGLAFIDISTLDSPRYDCLQTHGRTALGYQTNGQRWDGVQTLLVGDSDWGFRATYNILQGNDYVDGQGRPISSSYLSNNVSFALGIDFSPTSKLEFKGFSVTQNGLEFPGYYFDIDELSSAAYNLRYTLLDQSLFDKATLDLWYNYTQAEGTTRYNPKQQFVDRLLRQSFNAGYDGTNPDPNTTNIGNPFTDNSNTRFAGRSIGYRLAMNWGPQDNPLLTVGTDLNVFGQGLAETILFSQTAAAGYRSTNISTGQVIPPGQTVNYFQIQGIPNSQSADPGLFFQGQFKPRDDFKVKFGGRYDYVFTQSNPRLVYGNVDFFGPPVIPGQTNVDGRFQSDLQQFLAAGGTNDLQRHFNLGSAFLQGEYKVTDKITANAGVGYAMRAPTLTELYAAGPFIGVLQQGTSRLIGDPNLKSEKLLQVDLGLAANFETWQAGVNGFYSWIDDYITYDANSKGTGITQVVYTNTDRATLAGAEAFGQVEVASWLTAFGTMSYVQGIDQTLRDSRRNPNITSSRRDAPLVGVRVPESEFLPGIPPLESRLGIRFHECSKNPRWQVELGARIVTGQNNVARTLDEIATPGFTVYDIRTFWRVKENWLLTAGVENVGNIQYREHLDPISGTLVGTNPLYRPGINYYFGSQVTY